MSKSKAGKSLMLPVEIESVSGASSSVSEAMAMVTDDGSFRLEVWVEGASPDLTIAAVKALEEQYKPNTTVNLYLNGRFVVEVPPIVCSLGNLCGLTIRSLLLKELPEELLKAPRLNSFNLNINQMEQVPEIVCRMVNLEELAIWNTRITKLPEQLPRLVKLTKLQIDSNHFKGFPEIVSEMTNLQLLDLRNNRLDSMPESITRLVALETLLLDKNAFATAPRFLGRLPRLSFLSMKGEFIARYLYTQLIIQRMLCR